MSFIQDNGGPLAIAGMFLVVVGAYIELRLPSEADLEKMVNDAFVSAGTVEPHRMDQAEEDIDKLEETDLRLDAKAERIVQILLEE